MRHCVAGANVPTPLRNAPHGRVRLVKVAASAWPVVVPSKLW